MADDTEVLIKETSTKIYTFIKDGIINLITIGIALAYILYSMVQLIPTEASMWDALCKAALAIVCGLMIKQGLGENGFSLGYNSEAWHTEFEKYNMASNTAIDYMDRVDNYYYHREIEQRIAVRRAILMNARLRYHDYFDDKENYIEQDLSKLDRKQRRALKRACKVKIYNLNLFSEYENSQISSTSKRETGDRTQRVKMFGANSVSQVVIATAGAYFIPLFDGWNWGAIFMSTVQVMMWVGAGIMQLYSNYNYIVVDKINKLKTKKVLIQKFVIGCKNGLYTQNPYEERDKKIEAEKAAVQNDEEKSDIIQDKSRLLEWRATSYAEKTS